MSAIFLLSFLAFSYLRNQELAFFCIQSFFCKFTLVYFLIVLCLKNDHFKYIFIIHSQVPFLLLFILFFFEGVTIKSVIGFHTIPSSWPFIWQQSSLPLSKYDGVKLKLWDEFTSFFLENKKTNWMMIAFYHMMKIKRMTTWGLVRWLESFRP